MPDLMQTPGNPAHGIHQAYQQLMAIQDPQELAQTADQLVKQYLGNGISEPNYRKFQMALRGAINKGLAGVQGYLTNYMLKAGGMGVAESEISAIASLITEDADICPSYTPYQYELKTLVESYGYAVRLLSEAPEAPEVQGGQSDPGYYDTFLRSTFFQPEYEQIAQLLEELGYRGLEQLGVAETDNDHQAAMEIALAMCDRIRAYIANGQWPGDEAGGMGMAESHSRNSQVRLLSEAPNVQGGQPASMSNHPAASAQFMGVFQSFGVGDTGQDIRTVQAATIDDAVGVLRMSYEADYGDLRSPFDIHESVDLGDGVTGFICPAVRSVQPGVEHSGEDEGQLDSF